MTSLPSVISGTCTLDYIAFLAGYGGTDILEGLGKIIKVVPVEIK